MATDIFGHSKPRLAWGEQSESDNVLMKIEGLEQKLPVFDDLLRRLIEQHAAAKEDITDLRLEYESKVEESKSQGAARHDIERKLVEAEERVDILRVENVHLEEELKQAEAAMLKKEVDMTVMMEEKKINLLEIANLRSRLSQVMGSKLTDNNPTIADLSDRYRPSKLGEKYSELYDKEWAGAYEEINKTCDEKETIRTLLDILMYVNRKCQEYWKAYTTNLERTLTADSEIELPDFVIKQYKDVSKNVAPELIEHFYEKIANGAYEYTSGKVIRDRRCENYVKCCVTVCWLMAAQDPPVILDTEDRFSDTDFDTDLFRQYTQTGENSTTWCGPRSISTTRDHFCVKALLRLSKGSQLGVQSPNSYKVARKTSPNHYL